jgi:LysM repeat protein
MKKRGLAFFILLNSFSCVAAQEDTIINQRFNSIQNVETLEGAMNKLNRVATNSDSNFVVAHFGDSHIQGDNFSGVIRNNLQQAFGAGGEGILFPYSACKSFGPKNLTTTISGIWNYATLLKNPEKYPIGVTGYTLVTTDKTAKISFVYSPANEVQYGNAKIFETVTIWHSSNNFRLMLVNNGSADAIYPDSIRSSNGLYRTIITNYRVGTELKLQFAAIGEATVFNFHGINFENPSQHGLQYSHLGVVGATFLQLIAQQEFTIAQLKEMKPDLLIFSYGSNESYVTGLDMDQYHKKVLAFIQRIKTEFPNTNIIFTNTPDTRSGNRIPPNTNTINEKLKLIATETNSAYWDLNTIMGGKNSIYYWLKNGLAGKDQLHFTRAGYRLQANLFSLAFLDNYNGKFASPKIQILCDSLHFVVYKQLQSLTSVPKLSATDTTNSNQAQGEQTHIVKKGETLLIIARQHKVTVKQLCEWNGISEKTVLRVGQRIVIRKM